MANPRPQLNLDELRRFKWLLGGGLALLSLWTVFFLDVEALGLVAVASAVVVAALVWPALPARVPVWVWRLSVPAIIAALAVDFYFSPDTLPVLIRLAILLVLYRAVAYRRKREDLQLLVLGLFLIVVAGVLTVSLGFAFLLLLFTACALGFLFVVTLIDMVDTGPRVMRPEEMREVPAWARGGWGRLLGRLRQVADWRLLGFAAALFAGVVVISGLLFLLIPRFEMASGFFLDRYITRKSRTGFTESVRFGDVTELVRDESVAMRVDLTDAASIRERPYWRLLVMDEYTKEGFRMSTGLKNELLRTQRVTQYLRGRNGPLDTPASVGGVWTFYVEPGVSRFLPLPGSFGALRLRDPSPVQAHPGLRMVGLRTEALAMTAFQLEGVEFSAVVPDRAFGRLLEAAESAFAAGRSERAYDPRISLRGPEGPENAAALARLRQAITGGAEPGPLEFAEKAVQWLRDHHAYALSASIPRGPEDDIVKWLASAEPGFCEYFAAGLAVLSRSAGHPARVVAGFRGGALNAYENYFMVKNADAHAWVEVYDGEGAWVRFDPTPGASLLTGAAAAAGERQEQDSSWSARFDSLRVIWYRRVVNFDSRQQVEMVEAVKNFTTDSGTALRARLEVVARRLKAWLAGPWDWRRGARVLGGAALAAALGWGLWRAGGLAFGAWRRRRHPDRPDPVRREAARWLGRLEAEAPDAAGREEWTAVREALLRLRYGRRETWAEPRGVFRRARRVRRAARR